MNWKQRFKGSVIALIGFILSPLSWWNDLVVNIPLAVGFGWCVSLLYPPIFEAAVVVGYWLTNALGLILLRRGARDLFTQRSAADTRREFFIDVAVSLLYTVVILALLRLGLVSSLPHYFSRP